MISFIEGKIHRLNRDPAQAVLLTGGIGYEIQLPVYVYQALIRRGIKEGDTVEFQVYYHVTERQPRPQLVGFLHESERGFFEQLIQVEGIGPTKAAAALVFPASAIARAIETGDIGVLTRLPGVGPRAAQKILATLQGKVTSTALLRDESFDGDQNNVLVEITSVQDEAIDALIGLGYRPGEAQEQVEDALRRSPSTMENLEDLMREVFKSRDLSKINKED